MIFRKNFRAEHINPEGRDSGPGLFLFRLAFTAWAWGLGVCVHMGGRVHLLRRRRPAEGRRFPRGRAGRGEGRRECDW